MHAEALVAEIGSTTTLVSAFSLNPPRLLGQGQAATSVLSGDVREGLDAAIADLGMGEVEYDEMLASSSAAGGLRMTVHGLVQDMTARAAQAAALSAGAIVRMTTAGTLSDADMEDLIDENPNLILLAGGTDGGERETALYNARRIAEAGLSAPVVYAGNIQNQRAIQRILPECRVTENVYPRLDHLNIEPVRRILHEVFEKHIVRAPGMERIRERVNGAILPTPGAVMEAARLLYEEIGDLAVIDVGGATTDVHSVTEGSEEIAAIQTIPEPFAKRTVEGDLGLYVNAGNLAARIGKPLPEPWEPIPQTEERLRFAESLCVEAGLTALRRHAGTLRHLYGASGRQTVAEGKDLTQIRALVGTGGALTRLPGREAILRLLADCNKNRQMLFPREGEISIYFDNDYIMASLGVLGRRHPDAARKLLRQSLRLEEA